MLYTGMDTKNSISNDALARVSQLIREILSDPRSVTAVSPLVVSAALKVGIRISPPAAQAVSILLVAVCHACLEQFRGKTPAGQNETCSTAETEEQTSPSEIRTSKLIH